ncbi:CTB family bacteriocin [Nodularia sp. UHCC 0506]|uniref:CTB family bacteriocin n=1 Tax=Nodularia sp. UHCC 0506 TaxID=3110243 RepID=UPI002B20FD70|nr:CTB family bacteriocin [Nodularia sp. UHCC 0506]MEA5516187.1 CTB family bacteriocin [Nodularia sp. UHCC 0506]
MSYQISASELFVTLSDGQQELLAGGQDFELAGSNFANRVANLQGTSSAGPDGSNANSTGDVTAINTAAQDFMALGATEVPQINALGSAPVLNGMGNGNGGGGNGGGNGGG